MKRSWLILSLLVMICSYTFGYIIVYEEVMLLARYKTQLSLRENLESKIITKIEIPDNITNVSYISLDDDELIYYGKVYDIVWSEQSQNGRKVYCVYDDLENQLRDLINELYSDTPSTGNSKVANLKFILSKLNLQYTFSYGGLLLEQPVLISVLLLEKSSLVFTFLCGDTPPPKI
ncbi:MAG: hypothetical protein ACPL2D_01435 [Ignavibacteria bacterium]